ncbi:MAG: carbohydrate binding domain-containing protein [Planctomycetaceae bacterium]|nr:carbohydrate binding domain-containing protein [Planctomycetaceae bacterium]
MKCLASLAIFVSIVAFAEEPKNLLKPVNKTESWRLEEHEGGKGTLKVDGNAVVMSSTKVTGTDWHVQAVMTGLDLKEGQEYVLKFKAKAEGTNYIGVSMGIDEEDWHQIGLGEQMVVITKTPKEHEFRFRAESVNTKQKNRLTIALGSEICQITLTDLTLTVK